MPRLILVLHLAIAAVAYSQDLAEVEEQTSLSQILSASGTLYVLETHDLPSIPVLGRGHTECEIVILRFLAGDNTVTVGLEFTREEEYSERSARLEVHEAQALLTAFEMIANEGRGLLGSPTIDSTLQWSAEIHYATKEQVKVAAFLTRTNELRYGLKIGSRADWALLTNTGVNTLTDNLTQFVELTSGVDVRH